MLHTIALECAAYEAGSHLPEDRRGCLQKVLSPSDSVTGLVVRQLILMGQGCEGRNL